MSERPDPNLAALQRAGLDEPHARWLGEAAAVVDRRLDAVRADWRALPDAPALRAAAFGLLLGALARRYPRKRDVLSRVAEAHPSYAALPPTSRLATLERLCSEETLVAEWIGGLLGTDDPGRLRPLCALDDGDDQGSGAVS